jgi:hypothetical protein
MDRTGAVDAEVRKMGRSVVIRRAAAEYLRRSTARRIAEAYRRQSYQTNFTPSWIWRALVDVAVMRPASSR